MSDELSPDVDSAQAPAGTFDPKYWAFISYSRKDEAVAQRLHRRLETYRIPKELIGRPGRDSVVPARLFPVFRDRDELPLSSDLGASINDALRASKYLIVICSPNAARSQWVNEEIRYFKSLDRIDRILAIIVSGIPNGSDNPATADQECFPPALRYHLDELGQLSDQRTEPIGGDLRRGGDGWTSVLLKAVAGITGMGYDAFAKREAKRARRRRAVYYLLTLFMLSMGLWYWDYTRLKVRYFAGSREVWGVPQGVSPLSGTQRAARESSYRFEQRGYKTRRVELVNSEGSLVDNVNSGEARTDIIYREDGSLERLLLYNRNGKLLTQKSFSKPADANADGLRPCTISFLSKSEFAQTLKADSTGLAPPPLSQSDSKRTDITAYQAYFDSSGRLKSIFYRNAYGASIANSNGVYGQAFEYDQQGLLIKATNLDSAGQPMPDRRGVQAVRQENGALANVLKETYLDPLDQPILGPEHVAIKSYVYDQFGNLTERKQLDTTGQPTLHKDGDHRQTWQYNAAGHRIASSLFDTQGQPVFCRDLYAGYRVSYDARGYPQELTHLGPDGKPTLNKLGVATSRSKCDARGNYIESVLYDVDDQPTIASNGWSRINRKFDNLGNETESALYDPSGQPMLSKDGTWKVNYRFDDRGNQVEIAYSGIDGQPCTDSTGVSIQRMKYDERGNLEEEQYLGVDSQPTLHKSGMAKKTMRYDDHGNLLETLYWGMAGEPILSVDGYARILHAYDERGNLAEISFFGTTGALTLGKQGYAREVRSYDQSSFNTRRDYFGTDGRPILHSKGYARLDLKPDRYGNEIERAYFDRNYKPVADENGVHRVVIDLDERGNNTSMRTFGPTGAAIVSAQLKAAHVTVRYDAWDRDIETSFFDIGEQPTQGGEYLAARRTRSYDSRGNIVEERYFGIDNKPCRCVNGYAVAQTKYDAKGNALSMWFLGIDDQPCENLMGIARIEMLHDPMGRIADNQFFDLKGNPTEDENGAARIKQQYDSRGNVVEVSLYGRDGKPMIGVFGVAKMQMAYDSQGNIIEQHYFGVDGQPALSSQRMAHYKASYDSRGQFLSMECFGVDGQPCIGQFGSCAMKRSYDRQGRLLEEAAFDGAGKPMRAKSNYARMTVRYDARGNPEEQCYYDENGQPVLSHEGVARATYVYDQLGNNLEVSLFGADGKPVLNKDGYARRIAKRDQQGRLLEQHALGVDGEPIVSIQGWASQLIRYNQRGQEVEFVWLGADGKEIASKPHGAARVTLAYDEQGKLLELLRFAPGGVPLVHNELGYRELQTFHPSGAIANYQSLQLHPDRLQGKPEDLPSIHSQLNYDVDGKLVGGTVERYLTPTMRLQSKAMLERTTLDSSGREISMEFLNPEGKLVDGPQGFAHSKSTIDAYGNTVRVEALTESGQRTKSLTFEGREVPTGLIEVSYDAYGRAVEIRLLDEHDQPIVSEKIPARTVSEFSRSGKVLSQTQHFNLPATSPRTGPNALPIRGTVYLRPDGKIRETWVTREVSGSAETKDLIVSIDKANSSDQVTEHWYEDAEGKPVLGPDSIWKITYAFDRSGKVSSTRAYGLNGLTIHPKLDAAGIDRVYDSRGNEIQATRIGVDGLPFADKQGIAKTKHKWDDQSRLLLEAYYDVQDKLICNADGFAWTSRSYNDDHNVEERRWFNEKGEPVTSPYKVYRHLTRRTEAGRQIEEKFVDLDGKPMADKEGVYGVKTRLDDRQQVTELVLLDDIGQPRVGSEGFAKRITERDRAGNTVVERFLDAADKPVLGPSGFATYLRKERAPGQPSWEVLDEHDQPAKCIVVVEMVVPGGQAASLGLKPADVVLSYDEQPISHHLQMIELTNLGNAEIRPLVIQRAGQQLTFQVKKGRLGAALRTTRRKMPGV